MIRFLINTSIGPRLILSCPLRIHCTLSRSIVLELILWKNYRINSSKLCKYLRTTTYAPLWPFFSDGCSELGPVLSIQRLAPLGCSTVKDDWLACCMMCGTIFIITEFSVAATSSCFPLIQARHLIYIILHRPYPLVSLHYDRLRHHLRQVASYHSSLYHLYRSNMLLLFIFNSHSASYYSRRLPLNVVCIITIHYLCIFGIGVAACFTSYGFNSSLSVHHTHTCTLPLHFRQSQH